MAKQKKLFRGSSLIFIVIFLCVSLYFVYEKLNEQKIDPLSAVPESSSLFGEFSSLGNLYDKLNANEFWKDFTQLRYFDEFNKLLPIIDSVREKNSSFNEFVEDHACVLSLHAIDSRNELLLIIKTNSQHNEVALDRFFRETFTTNFTKLRSKYEGEQIHKLIFNNYQKTFSYSVVGDLIIASVNEQLIKSSIDQIRLATSILNKAEYQALSSTAGKKVDGNIYINYSHFSDFLNLVSSQKNTQTNEKAFNFSQLTELDLILKNDEILFNGYTNTSDSTLSSADLFYGQEAQEIKIDGILPFHTSYLFHYGFNDFQTYFNKLKEQKQALKKYDNFRRRITNINVALKTNIEESLVPYIGNEVAVFSLANRFEEFEEKSYVAFNTTNLPQLKRNLEILSGRIRNSGSVKTYKGVQLFRLNKTRIPEALFGSNFKVVKNFNYAIINGYVIVANSIPSLESFITHYQSGKTLDLNNNYQAFSDNVSKYSNIYVYFSFRNGLNLLSDYFKTELFEEIAANASFFRNIQAAACQFSNINNKLYTSLYLKYNPSIIEENRSVWKVNMDNDVVGQPYLIRNHRNNTFNIIAFDVDNKMYVFDSEGNLLWKKAINEPVISEVFAIDYYKNGKIQYLFNTPTKLHLIDLLGRNVENYPVRLNQNANNGLSVFDYGNDRNYRFVFAGTDKKIYNFDKNGKQVSGWTKAQALGNVDKPLQHIRHNRRDYIFLMDANGSIRILNRQGKDRILLKRNITQALNSSIYVNSTNNKGQFITTDKTGKLTYIASNGNIQTTDFGTFSENHFFLYEDFNKNGHKDFTYLDNNTLTVFDRFKKVIFTYSFKNNITIQPKMIHLSRNESLLGIVSDESSEIFLFNKRGEVMISSGLIGETPFVLKSLLNNSELNLIVGEGSSLYNYIIR